MCIRDRRTADITAFWQGSHRCLLIMHSFSVMSANIAVSDISLKTRFVGLHLCRRKYRCIFNHFYVIGRTGTEFGRKKAKWRPLRHSRLFKVTDFGTNRKLICDFPLVINSNIYPILHRFQVMAHYWSIFASESRTPHFNSLTMDDPVRISRRSLPLHVLPVGANRMIVASFVSTQYQHVTEGQTDRQTDRHARI